MKKIISKPWGREMILTEENLPYTAKIFFIEASKRISLQYHDQKEETIALISGQANIVWGDSEENLKTESMELFFGYTIHPNTIHRFQAVTDSYFIEASTSEKGNTIRLQDDFSRTDETEEVRNLPNRGWTPN